MVGQVAGILEMCSLRNNMFFMVQYIGPMKKEMKDGSQKEMFLLCYIIDLPRVKEKRWWHSGILYGFTNINVF
ncbi:uncharacterized protein LOC141893261 isoform X3 [Acropora palmata]|uniref:uncharacterized protein LOC141893261 isoform X3 n=1 Tax=Acropora palmata TaxID=6131 RepID=UPI003DA0F690